MMRRQTSKITSKITIKTIQSDLDLLNNRYRALSNDFRVGLYDLMAQAARIIVTLRRNKQLRKRFRKSVMESRPKPSRSTFDLSTDVFARVMGAETRVARQKAWKRARVVDALLDDGITIEKIARTIKKRGGVERICGEAAASPGRHDRAKKRESGISQPRRKAEEAHPKRVNLESNDGEVTIQFRIRLSERDDLLEKTNVGCRIKMTVLRVGRAATDFKITKAKVVSNTNTRSEVDNDESDEDWR
jgi:hypothetical protein